MSQLIKGISIVTVLVLMTGCVFFRPKIRYVVDVKPPLSKDGAIEDKRQDKGHPAVDEIRPTVKLKRIKKRTDP